MTGSKLVSFSPDGEKLAHSGPDGIVRIWNTKSGILEHEYKPAEHLTATISCIKYSPEEVNKNGKVRLSLLAMGTLAGTVLIYSPSKKDIVGTLEHGPPHAVLDITWKSFNTLVSVGADNKIVEWNIESGEKRKTAQVKEANSICVINEKMLVVGHRSIQSVSLTEDSKLETHKSFTGHISLISQLLPIQTTKGLPRYFLSASEDDRFFYAWDLQSESSEAVGSFMVQQPISSVATGVMKSNSVVMLAVTSKGTLVLFRQHLNGNASKAAVKPVGKYRINFEGSKKIIPIIATFINKSSEYAIIVYGSSAVLKFEKKNIKDLEGETSTEREAPMRVDINETLMKTVTPKLPEKSTMLGPTHHLTAMENEKKRKLGDTDGAAALPMEERLNALILDKSGKRGTQIPKGDHMKQLILQSLHSKDKRFLISVLTQNDKTIISNTVRYLPPTAVVPLLEILQDLFTGKGCKHSSYIKWVRALLYYHMSHLSTIPDRAELMRPFLSLCMSKLSTHAEITKLQARLDLMLKHVEGKHLIPEEREPEPEAMLIYNDDSSEDEDNVRKTGISESEEQWEELSDYGEMNGHSDTDSEMDVDNYNLPYKRKIGEEEEIVLDSDSDDGDDEAEEDSDSELEVPSEDGEDEEESSSD